MTYCKKKKKLQPIYYNEAVFLQHQHQVRTCSLDGGDVVMLCQKRPQETAEHLQLYRCQVVPSNPTANCVYFPPSDLPTGSYIQEDLSRCSSLCEAGRDCCDLMASCKCGTHTGQYDCICEKGYYGKGLQHECTGRTLSPYISLVLCQQTKGRSPGRVVFSTSWLVAGWLVCNSGDNL